MQKDIQRSEERGVGKHSWLSSRFSFSFADYYNPSRLGFGKLLVINDDTIMAGKGFGSHSHQNMEIITIVMQGSLEHKDSTGISEVLKPGDVQLMSAGTGIVHSEYNHSSKEALQLFQIWIQPDKKNVTPRHATAHFSFPENKLILVVSGKKTPDALLIHQDAAISLGKFQQGKKVSVSLSKDHGLYVFVIEGKLEVGIDVLEKRDAIGITDMGKVDITFLEHSFVMIFDVVM